MEEASTSDSDISMAFALRIQPHVDSEETCECAFQGLPTLMLMSLESFVPLPPKICYSAELRCEIFRRIGQSREKLLREFWRSFFQQWPHIQALHHCRLGRFVVVQGRPVGLVFLSKRGSVRRVIVLKQR